MLPLLSMALAIFIVSTAAQVNQLPPTFELVAREPQTLTQIGCVMATGNFTTSKTRCYPFRSPQTSAPEAKILVMGIPCTVADTFACYGSGGPNDPVGLFTNYAGFLSTDSNGTAFSVDSLNMTAVNSVGAPIGTQLLIGNAGMYQLVLGIHAVSG